MNVKYFSVYFNYISLKKTNGLLMILVLHDIIHCAIPAHPQSEVWKIRENMYNFYMIRR